MGGPETATAAPPPLSRRRVTIFAFVAIRAVSTFPSKRCERLVGMAHSARVIHRYMAPHPGAYDSATAATPAMYIDGEAQTVTSPAGSGAHTSSAARLPSATRLPSIDLSSGASMNFASTIGRSRLATRCCSPWAAREQRACGGGRPDRSGAVGEAISSAVLSLTTPNRIRRAP